jgi:hypothetical protein
MIVIDNMTPLEILMPIVKREGTTLENITDERLIQMDIGGLK